MDLLEQCRQIIATADPMVRLDALAPGDIAAEALAIASFAVDYWRKHQELKQDSSSTLLLVPESVLTQYGVPIQDLELTTYDSNPTPARFDAFPVVRHKVGFKGLKIAVTHKAGEDHRFGKPMLVSYGHLEGSYGDGDDGQSHDFFLGHDASSDKLLAIQQLKPDGTKDERKFGIHFPDAQSFKESYQAQLPDDLQDKLFGGVWETDINDLQKYRTDAYHADSCGCEVCEAKQKRKVAIAQVGKKRRNPKPEEEDSDRVDAAKMTQAEANFNDEDNGKPCNACKNWLGIDKQQPAEGEAVRDEHIPVGRCKLVEGALWELASCDRWEAETGDRVDAKKRIWVKDPSAKGGGYWQEREVKDPTPSAPHPIPSTHPSEVSHEPGHGKLAQAGHLAMHLGENVLSWKVGKVVGGAIGTVAAHHGVNPEAARLISESSVQALTATALFARHPENRTPDAIATKFVSEISAAFAGKIAHGAVDQALSGGDPHVEAIGATVAGKGTGIATVTSVGKALKHQGQVLKGLLDRHNGAVSHTDAAAGDVAGLTDEEKEAIFDLSLAGYILSGRQQEGEAAIGENPKERDDAGEPCGDGWITPGEECHAGPGRQQSQIRIPAGFDSAYLMFKSLKVGDGKYTGIPNPERDLARKFYAKGLDSDLSPVQLEQLRQNPKALVTAIETWDRGSRSLLQAAQAREEQYRAGTLSDSSQRFGARQIEALQNSVKINGIIRREFIAAVTGDKADPYIGGNALYGFRAVKDRRGTTQNIANVAYLPNGATRIFLMVTAPQNLSVNGIWKPYHGENTKAIAQIESQRMPGSSSAMLEGLIRENLAKGGTGQMECAPLDLNKPLFQRAGFREGEDDEFILNPDAARKFLEMRDRVNTKKDAAMDDIEAQQWQQELNDLEEELGGMMVLPKKQQPKTDADDQDQDLADWLVDQAQGETVADFKQWTDGIKQWFGSFDSIEAIQQSLTKQPDGCYDQLNPDALETLLYQSMMLADLGGRLDAQAESPDREDATKPSWLKLPFKEAIAFLRQKVTIPTNDYVKMSEGYHGWAFSVARMTKASMVDDAKWVVEKGLTEGYGYDRLIKMWNRLIGRKGWQASGSRVYTILDTNIRSAYSAGRAQQVFDPDLQGDDVIVWRHRDSRVPRPLHLALHDKAIAASDPFWQIAFPSCGWGCKCSAFRTSRGYAERNGIEVLAKAPDPNTIADPGFRFNRAGVSESDRQAIIDSTLDTLSPVLRQKVESDLQKR